MTAWTPEDRSITDLDGWQVCQACDHPIDCSDSAELDAYERSDQCLECETYERDLEATEHSLSPGRV
jgi:hypothetical protein